MVIHCYIVHIDSKRQKCYIVIVYICGESKLTLNALRENRYKEVILTNYIGNGCFSGARRDSYDGLITQTGIVHPR